MNYEYMFIKKVIEGGVIVFYLKCYIWDSDKNYIKILIKFELKKKIRKEILCIKYLFFIWNNI